MGQFVNVSAMLGMDILVPGTEIGKALSFHDIDRNGWDDLSISTGIGDPLFFFNDNGQFIAAPFSIANSPTANINMLLWADFDNDGDADLLITKENAPLQLWRNDGDWQFTNIAAQAGLEQANYLYKGAAFCDYDHDGDLDLYISKFYTGFNPGLEFRGMLYRNNGDGTFTEVTQQAGVLIGSAPIFQPVFMDYDNDGWEDLFLVIDRVFHQNELFRNNGDGTFTSVSESSGMDIMIDSMTGTVGDFDQDGDLDVYISANPYSGQHLMRNNGDGTFTSVGPQMGVDLAEVGWGGLWIDHDNNGWQDLLMCLTSPVQAPIGNQFFINQEGTGFVASNPQVGLEGDLTETYVCVMGDLDRDGYPDFMTNNRMPHPAKLYNNTTGTNHWLTVRLQGVFANRDGVGTWVKCYAGGMGSVRFSLCGSDLMGQSAQRLMFGLGQNTVIDSLVLEWNSGTRDVYFNLLVDQHLILVEGADQSPLAVNITYDNNLPVICPGGSLLLDAGPGFESYLWNTGAQSQTISVSQPGTYQVSTTTSMGFLLVSPPLEVTMAPGTQVSISSSGPSCFGAGDGSITVSLSTGMPQSIMWNTGDTGTELTGLGTGAYSFNGIDAFGCEVFGGVFLNEPQSLFAFVQTTDVICHGTATGSAVAMVLGGTPPYDLDWGFPDPHALPAGDHEMMITDDNGCTASFPYSIIEPPALTADIATTPSEVDDGTAFLVLNGGVPPYAWTWSTGQVNVDMITDLVPGEYSVVVTDANFCMAEFGFVIHPATGIPEWLRNIPRLAPNPTSGLVWLLGHPCDQLLEVFVTDGSGRVVVIRQNWSCGAPLDLRDLSPGRYAVRFTSAQGAWVMPLVLLSAHP